MKLIKPSFEIREQPSGLEGVYNQIEGAGRVCYKSEDKIAEGTAKAFVDRMIASGHGAMLEHGTVYLKCETEVINRYNRFLNVYRFNNGWNIGFAIEISYIITVKINIL